MPWDRENADSTFKFYIPLKTHIDGVAVDAMGGRERRLYVKILHSIKETHIDGVAVDAMGERECRLYIQVIHSIKETHIDGVAVDAMGERECRLYIQVIHSIKETHIDSAAVDATGERERRLYVQVIHLDELVDGWQSPGQLVRAQLHVEEADKLYERVLALQQTLGSDSYENTAINTSCEVSSQNVSLR